MTREGVTKQLDRPATTSAWSLRLGSMARLRALVRVDGEQFEIGEQLVSLTTPGSFAADRYRTLRHTVERLHKESALQVLAITSPGPGDGKSVTALNVAGALAQSADARVLIVDADLRRPRVAEYLGLGGKRWSGLAEAILDSECTLPGVVRRVEGFNLWALLAGTPHPSPYELLNSHRMEALLAEARRQFDYVLIDTPPIVPFADARLLGRWTDGSLMIVAAHKTPRKMLAEALNLIDPAKLIGVVLNGDNRPMYGHYGYYYSSDTRPRHADWWRRVFPARHSASQQLR